MYVYQLVEESVNKYLNMLPNKLSTNKKLQTTPSCSIINTTKHTINTRCTIRNIHQLPTKDH